jgi:hypothetical protein
MLACFGIRHQIQTSREIGGTGRQLVKIAYSGTIDLLQQQKQDKDNWALDNKEPEYTLLTLDTATATKVFDKVKSILARVHGVTGVPLAYVIRVVLIAYVIRVVLIPEDKKENPHFGEEETKYTSVDMKTMARAPILSDKADIFDKDPENLEAY